VVRVKDDGSRYEGLLEEEPDLEVRLHESRLLGVEDPLPDRFGRREEVEERVSFGELRHDLTGLLVQLPDGLQGHVAAFPPVDLAAPTGDHLRPVEGERDVGVRLALQEVLLGEGRVVEEWVVVVEVEVDPKVEVFVVQVSFLFRRRLHQLDANVGQELEDRNVVDLDDLVQLVAVLHRA